MRHVPHDARRDALAAAAEWILAVERAGGTVGRATVEPNVRNVIPARVTATLDLRHPDDATRRAAVDVLRRLAGGDAMSASSGATSPTSPPSRWTSASRARSESTPACAAAPGTTRR